MARELLEMRRLDEADLLRFRERRLDGEPVTHHAPDHPERADTNGGGAVDEHRAVGRVVRDSQELVGVGVGRVPIVDRDVEVP